MITQREGIVKTLEEQQFHKEYQLRMAQPGKKSIEVTVPYELVEREARSEGLTVQEFIGTYKAIAHYGNSRGVYYSFERQS